MAKFKRKLIFLIILAIAFTSLGVFATYKLLIAPKKAPKQWTSTNLSNISSKFFIQDTLVREIRKKKEIIPFEVDLEETVTIDDSWGDLSIFKKIQNINFYGRGIYSIDVSCIDNKSIVVDKSDNSLVISIPKPIIKGVVIEETRTIYTSPELGILRFGEVTLTPAEYDSLISKVKEKMTNHLLSSDLYDVALKESEEVIKNILTVIISQNNIKESNLKINFK